MEFFLEDKPATLPKKQSFNGEFERLKSTLSVGFSCSVGSGKKERKINFAFFGKKELWPDEIGTYFDVKKSELNKEEINLIKEIYLIKAKSHFLDYVAEERRDFKEKSLVNFQKLKPIKKDSSYYQDNKLAYHFSDEVKENSTAIMFPCTDRSDKVKAIYCHNKKDDKGFFLAGSEPLGTSFYVNKEQEISPINKVSFISDDIRSCLAVSKELKMPSFCCFKTFNLKRAIEEIRVSVYDMPFIVYMKDNNDFMMYQLEKNCENTKIVNYKDDLYSLFIDNKKAAKKLLSYSKDDFIRIYCLGYEGLDRYYTSDYNKSIVCVKGSNTKGLLESLAPYRFWLKKYGVPSEDDPSEKVLDVKAWCKAGSDLFDACMRQGPYSNERLYGAGVWKNNKGELFCNTGSSIYGNASDNQVPVFSSYFEGPRVKDAEIPFEDLKNTFNKLPFLENYGGLSLLAWLSLAPMTGVLPFRPPLWFNGSSDSGKSWIMNHIVDKWLNRWATFVASSSTESGIRQDVGVGARPYIFDEFEIEEYNSDNRNKILELVRGSVTANQRQVTLKGSSKHKAQQFRNNSIYIFSSIKNFLSQEADHNRFVVLNLSKNKINKKQFDDLKRLYKNIDFEKVSLDCFSKVYHNFNKIEKDFIANESRLKLRSKIAHSYKSFALFYSVIKLLSDNNKEVLDDYENKFIKFLEQGNEDDKAHNKLLSELMAYRNKDDGKDWSIGDIVVESLFPARYEAHHDLSYAVKTIARWGFRVIDTGNKRGLAIANSHPYISKMTRYSEFKHSYKNVLRQIPTAERVGKPMRFGTHISKFIFIPKHYLEDRLVRGL